jgi:hypothetical protein
MPESQHSTTESQRAARPQLRLQQLLQITLRTLLIAVTIICIVFGWWVSGARRQQAAVAAIARAKGEVGYDFQFGVDLFTPTGQERPAYVPAWLFNAMGVDWFAEVERVIINDSRSHRSYWNDDDMRNLKRLTSLRVLSLPGGQFTDASLENIKGLTALQFLRLSGNQITDAGMEQLRGLTSLKMLHLSDTQISDAGVKRLSRLTSLQSLALDGTQITDAGLAQLKGFPSLQILAIHRTQITDMGLEHLKGQTSLCTLFVGHTQITDVSVEYLSSLKSLQNLTIYNTNITNAGRQRLIAALPKCVIYGP